MRESHNFELDHLKRRRRKNILTFYGVSGLVLLWHLLLIMLTLENGQYVAITAYKLDFEIVFCILVYCVSMISLHIESSDSMILTFVCMFEMFRCSLCSLKIHCQRQCSFLAV